VVNACLSSGVIASMNVTVPYSCEINIFLQL
jgi:hypothetical protein